MHAGAGGQIRLVCVFDQRSGNAVAVVLGRVDFCTDRRIVLFARGILDWPRLTGGRDAAATSSQLQWIACAGALKARNKSV